jgi:hypothetical protein
VTGQSGDAPRRLRRRPSRLKGRSAIAARRPPAALDPGASAIPERPKDTGRPGGLPAGRAALGRLIHARAKTLDLQSHQAVADWLRQRVEVTRD